jgi:hypothetical protein
MRASDVREPGLVVYLAAGVVVALLVWMLFAIRRTAWYKEYRRSVDEDFEG